MNLHEKDARILRNQWRPLKKKAKKFQALVGILFMQVLNTRKTFALDSQVQ